MNVSVQTPFSPWNPDTGNSNHVVSGLFSPVLDSCSSSWESVSCPTSCLAGFCIANANSSLPTQVPTAHVPWVLFSWTTGPPTDLTQIDRFLHHMLCGKHTSPPTFFTFPPFGFPGWSFPWWWWPKCLSRLSVAKGRGGNGLEEQATPTGSASLPRAQGARSFWAALWFGLLSREQGHFWALKDGTQK